MMLLRVAEPRARLTCMSLSQEQASKVHMPRLWCSSCYNLGLRCFGVTSGGYKFHPCWPSVFFYHHAHFYYLNKKQEFQSHGIECPETTTSRGNIFCKRNQTSSSQHPHLSMSQVPCHVKIFTCVMHNRLRWAERGTISIYHPHNPLLFPFHPQSHSRILYISKDYGTVTCVRILESQAREETCLLEEGEVALLGWRSWWSEGWCGILVLCFVKVEYGTGYMS